MPTFHWDLVGVGAGLDAKKSPLAHFPGSHCSWTGLGPTWGLSRPGVYSWQLLLLQLLPVSLHLSGPQFSCVEWLCGRHGPRALCQVGGPRVRCGRKPGCSVLLRACGS